MNITDLPYECIVNIFENLNSDDIISLREVCDVFRDVVKYVKCEKSIVYVPTLDYIYQDDELIYGFVKYSLDSFPIPKPIFNRNTEIIVKYSRDICNLNGIKKLTINCCDENDDLTLIRDVQVLRLVDYEIETITLAPNNTIKKLRVANSKHLRNIINADNVEDLDISDTKVFDVSSFKKLVNLDMSFNNTLTVVSNLDNLKNIYAINSSLTVVDNLPNLEFLKCDNSNLRTLTSVPKLEELSANKTKLSDVSELSSLEKLYLSNYDNRKVDGVKFLTNLTHLNIIDSYKVISSFKGLDKLVDVSCSGKIKDMNCLTSLKSLYLSYSDNVEVANLPNLTSLTINKSRVRKIYNLPKIKSIYLEDYRGGISDLPSLQKLSIRRSNINFLENLPNLKRLTMCGPGIETDVCNLPNLDYLYLLETNVSNIGNLPKLNNIVLRSNKLLKD